MNDTFIAKQQSYQNVMPVVYYVQVPEFIVD